MFLMLITMMVAADNKDAIDLAKEGKVATLSTDYKGTPFGSLTPYAIDENGDPIIYVSSLAVHTKNLKANAKCSLMVGKVDEKDVFNSARITYLGEMTEVKGKEVDAVKKAYFAKYKGAEKLGEFHDFAFYKMKVGKVYYIGGFGDIRWIDVDDYRKEYKK